MSIAQAAPWFDQLEDALTPKSREIARRILKEIRERLRFLMNVGLDYLTLSRASATLSGGESQRIRLASQIGSGLTGVLYVLDEPSIGLHQRDNRRLLDTLLRLRDLGNTVLVVEHDEEAICSADYLIDLGPGAGVKGGHVVAAGSLETVLRCPESLTAQYLTRFRQIPVPEARRPGHPGQMVTVRGARANNLQNITAEIPLGTFTCITGVSGGGKSTLIVDTLYKAVARRLYRARLHGAPMTGSTVSNTWTRSSTSTRRPSAARRARIRRPTPAPSPRSAAGSPACPRPRPGATGPGGFPSTSRAAAARPARAAG